MKNSNWFLLGILIVLVALGYVLSAGKSAAPVEYAKVGLVAELTGDRSAVGTPSRNAAELAVAEINQKGGVMLDGKRHLLQLLVEDNASNVDQTKSKVEKLIKQDNVVAIVGPNASSFAIPAGEVANQNKVALISPWSTNPATTQNNDGSQKPYVFRAAYTDPFQGRVLAKYASDDLKAKKAAIIYDGTADVLVKQAEFFKDSFSQAGGTIVATQTIKAGDTDFAAQLKAVKDAGPDVIFLPVYYNDAANVIKQAKAQSITTPFLGSDAWEGQEFLTQCGQACEGFAQSAHYSSDSTNAATRNFVDHYRALFNATPNDIAALTYDSFGLLTSALKSAGKVDREAVKNGIADIRNYNGVTGKMEYSKDSGDPVKGLEILKIQNGKYVWQKHVNP